MLKESKVKETIGFFCHIFVIGNISIGGRGDVPPGYAYVRGLNTNILEFLRLKHDIAYRSVDLEESMCVIMNAIQLPGIVYFTRYVGVSLISLTKRMLRTQTCFEIMLANIGKNLF